MTSTDEFPVFPAPAPEVMSDPAVAKRLFSEVLEQLATVVDIKNTASDEGALEGATPCDGFNVGQLRQHVLGWLQFFAAALNDPTKTTERLDPNSWQLPDDTTGAAIVTTALDDIKRAIDELPAGQLVVMSEARMTKEAVLAMALGEYLTHGWDLSVSTGQPWQPSEGATAPALEFLRGTVVPEYRGPDTGFFDAEVPAPEGASTFEQLLCFCGRDPAVRFAH